MGYRVLSARDERFQPRKGLEGPFYFSNGRVLYYDTKEGSYWDPLTDFYVPNSEVIELHDHFVKQLSN